MASRRCFSQKITEADAFKTMSVSAQALYLHLCMNADDDGFINNAVTIANQLDGGPMALEELTGRRFLLRYDGVYVVKHWRVANTLKNDRSKEPSYPELAAQIYIKNNRVYTDHIVSGCPTLFEAKTGTKPPKEWNPNGIQMESKWNPNGIPTEPNRIEPNRTEPNRTEPAKAVGVWGEIIRLYPDEKVGNRKAAEAAYREAVKSDADAEQMLSSLQKWLQSEQWNKNDGQYIPYMSNWITRNTWRDAPGKLITPTGGTAAEPGLAEMEAIWQMMDPAHFEENRAEWLRNHGRSNA